MNNKLTDEDMIIFAEMVNQSQEKCEILCKGMIRMQPANRSWKGWLHSDFLKQDRIEESKILTFLSSKNGRIVNALCERTHSHWTDVLLTQHVEPYLKNKVLDIDERILLLLSASEYSSLNEPQLSWIHDMWKEATENPDFSQTPEYLEEHGHLQKRDEWLHPDEPTDSEHDSS